MAGSLLSEGKRGYLREIRPPPMTKKIQEAILPALPRICAAHISCSWKKAAQLLARERRIEAEALIENVKARIRYSQPQKAPASSSHADDGDEHAASSAQSSAPR